MVCLGKKMAYLCHFSLLNVKVCYLEWNPQELSSAKQRGVWGILIWRTDAIFITLGVSLRLFPAFFSRPLSLNFINTGAKIATWIYDMVWTTYIRGKMSLESKNHWHTNLLQEDDSWSTLWNTWVVSGTDTSFIESRENVGLQLLIWKIIQ